MSDTTATPQPRDFGREPIESGCSVRRSAGTDPYDALGTCTPCPNA